MAIAAWNMMGGLSWEALPVIIEYFGVQDPEILIDELIAIRTHLANQRDAR